MQSSAGARRLQFAARLLHVVLELLLALPVGVGETRSRFSAFAGFGPGTRSGACTRTHTCSGSGTRTCSGSGARSASRASRFPSTRDAKALAGKRVSTRFACRFRLAQRLLGRPHLLLFLFALDPGVPKFLQELDLARTRAAEACR